MSPPMPCARITLAASRDTRKEPRAITACWVSQSAAVVSASGLDTDRPALLTTRSTPPNASAPTANAPAMLAPSVTSAAASTAHSAGPRAPGRRRAPARTPVGGPVGGVQLEQPALHLGQRRGRRQVEDQRRDLGPQEVVRA